jgi:hypothetical protein
MFISKKFEEVVRKDQGEGGMIPFYFKVDTNGQRGEKKRICIFHLVKSYE